jgi:GH15 family glucan-1,4-alpha-glucosidase
MKDRSIWEVRGEEQHFVYSKVMCWVALDRAIHIAEVDNHRAPIQMWRIEADKIKAEVLEKGWSEGKQSFVQHYGTDAVDASALIIPFVGFLPTDDPRIRSTVHRVKQELSRGVFVKRYLTEETDDGLKGDEGAFVILSFWLIGALLAIGETEESTWRFKALVAHANHLGLFAEMVDPITGKSLGNFPQAFSHIGFLHTAINLGRVLQAGDYEDLLG